MDMTERHNEVRHRWLFSADLDRMERILKAQGFTTDWHRYPRDAISLKRFVELDTKADTLTAHLSTHKAIIFQHAPAPLTERDKRLVEILYREYSHSMPLFGLILAFASGRS